MGLDRSPDQLIKTGLVALKQQNYDRAIAIFQQLRQDDTLRPSYRLKAQMGLIRTYEAQGHREQAKALCQSLIQSRSQSIRQWGHDKLQQLHNRTPNASTASGPVASSGFVPLEDAHDPAMADRMSASAIQDATAAEVGAVIPEGHRLETQTMDQTTEAATEATTVTSQPALQKPPLDDPTTNVAGASVLASGASLFHYQTLNRPASPDNDSMVEAVSVNRAGAPESPQSPPVAKPMLRTAQGPDTWGQGDRLQKIKALGRVARGRLWLAQIVTLGLLVWVVRWLVQTALLIVGNYVQFLNQWLPLRIPLAPIFWQSHTWTVIVGLVLLAVASPWLWPPLMGVNQNLTSVALKQYSLEAEQLMRRVCAKRRWPLPTIGVIPTDLPLLFSVGWWPRHGRLLVSQGVLDRLSSDELAALLMYEMAHWPQGDWVLFSTHGLLVQLFHRAYWFLARWGEARPRPLKWAAGALATLSYGVFWLLMKVGCGLSRTRIPYCDRTASEITGNPNGLMRGLAKLSQAMQQAIIDQGYTPPLLESLALMLPVAPDPAAELEQFAWGAFHPMRPWFAMNQPHRPLGERLYTLAAYCRHWRLQPSLNFAPLRLRYGKGSLTAKNWPSVILWSGLWAGALMGLGVVLVLWLIGAIAAGLDVQFLAWLDRDRSILISMPLIAAATVQLVRINLWFPDISPSMPVNGPQLTNWQTDMKLTPLSNLPLKVNGTLTGRPPLANWLGQEWRLLTEQGSIQLRHVAFWPLSNLVGLSPWLQQTLQVTGWFRRGHHLWIDVDYVSPPAHGGIHGQHPIWSIILSLFPLIYGIVTLIQGG